MASDACRRHFADKHTLLRTPYNSTSGHVCDICRTRLAGLVGYRCNACDFDVHEACADYFQETTSFFAHPWHPLILSRIPADDGTTWYCDLCLEGSPPGMLMYRCVGCMFDVHPLCTMLPQKIRSPLHPDHDLFMLPSTRPSQRPHNCGACRGDLPMWHYMCSSGPPCRFRMHVTCPATSTSTGAAQPELAAAASASQAASSTQSNLEALELKISELELESAAQALQLEALKLEASKRPAPAAAAPMVKRKSDSGAAVAKFILKTSASAMINAATGGLATPVLHVLDHAFNS